MEFQAGFYGLISSFLFNKWLGMILDINSLQKCHVNPGASQAPFLILLSSSYTFMSSQRCHLEHEIILYSKCDGLAAVNTLPNTIIYLKTVKYLNIRLRQVY